MAIRGKKGVVPRYSPSRHALSAPRGGMLVVQICRFSRAVPHNARTSVSAIRTWRIPGSSATVGRLLQPVRHLASQDNYNTSFEKVVAKQSNYVLESVLYGMCTSIRRTSSLFPTYCRWAGSSFLQHWGTWSSQKTTRWLSLSLSLQVSATW